MDVDEEGGTGIIGDEYEKRRPSSVYTLSDDGYVPLLFHLPPPSLPPTRISNFVIE